MPADLLSTTIAWIHNLAVILWIGGAFYFEFILRPSLSDIPPDQVKKINQGIAQRFAPLAWGSIVLLAITGILRLMAPGTGEFLWFLSAGAYTNTLILKLIILVVMIAIGGYVGYMAAQLPKATSREEALALQRKMKLSMRSNILLGVIVVFVAFGLSNGGF